MLGDEGEIIEDEQEALEDVEELEEESSSDEEEKDDQIDDRSKEILKVLYNIKSATIELSKMEKLLVMADRMK